MDFQLDEEASNRKRPPINRQPNNFISKIILKLGLASDEKTAGTLSYVLIAIILVVAIVFVLYSAQEDPIDEKYYFDPNEPTDDI